MTDRFYLAAIDLCARKLLEDEPTLGVNFPYVTAPSGEWVTMPASLGRLSRNELEPWQLVLRFLGRTTPDRLSAHRR